MSEAAYQLASLDLLGCCALLRHLYQRREVLRAARLSVGYVLRARITNHAGGEQPVQVGVLLLQRDEAVGGQQDRAVERLELPVLMPPGAAVVAHEVIVLLEGRVVVGRQHLAVGVDVDPCPLGLLQQLLHILQIVSGDKYPRVAPHSQVDLGDLRVAVGLRVGLVEQRHRGDGVLAGLHDHRDHVVDGELFRRGGKPLHHRGVDLVLLEAQHLGVLRIGGDSLRSDDEKLSERAHVLVIHRGDAHLGRVGLRHYLIPARRLPDGAVRQSLRSGARRPGPLGHCVPNL